MDQLNQWCREGNFSSRDELLGSLKLLLINSDTSVTEHAASPASDVDIYVDKLCIWSGRLPSQEEASDYTDRREVAVPLNSQLADSGTSVLATTNTEVVSSADKFWLPPKNDFTNRSVEENYVVSSAKEGSDVNIQWEINSPAIEDLPQDINTNHNSKARRKSIYRPPGRDDGVPEPVVDKEEVLKSVPSPKKTRRRRGGDDINTPVNNSSSVSIIDKKSDKKVNEYIEAIQFAEKNNLGRLAVSSSNQSLLNSLQEESQFDIDDELKPMQDNAVYKQKLHSDRTQRIDKIQETILNTINGLAVIMSALPTNNNSNNNSKNRVSIKVT